MEDLNLSEVRRVVEDLTAKYPELVARLDKAAAIIACRPVELVSKDLYKVGSWEERDCTYVVTLKGEFGKDECQCMDWSHRAPGGRCKHVLAAYITRALTPPSPAMPKPAPQPLTDVDMLYGRPELRTPDTYAWRGNDGAGWTSARGLSHLAPGA